MNTTSSNPAGDTPDLGQLQVHLTSAANGYPIAGASVRVSYTGVPDSTVNALESVLGLLLGEVDLSALDLNSNALLNRVFDMLSAFGLDLGLDLKGMSGAEFIDDVLNSYVTDAFYASLGEIAHGIVYAFMIDEDAHTENSVGEYALYKWDETLAASWVSGEVDNTPTAERGMLPTQLTVTFGDEPKTTKNFVWFLCMVYRRCHNGDPDTIYRGDRIR